MPLQSPAVLLEEGNTHRQNFDISTVTWSFCLHSFPIRSEIMLIVFCTWMVCTVWRWSGMDRGKGLILFLYTKPGWWGLGTRGYPHRKDISIVSDPLLTDTAWYWLPSSILAHHFLSFLGQKVFLTEDRYFFSFLITHGQGRRLRIGNLRWRWTSWCFYKH